MNSEDFTVADLKAIVLFIMGLIGVVFMIAGLGFAIHAIFAPANEEVRRKTYDQSRSYQQGMAVDLDELCRQRRLATDDGVKATLADTIRLRSARFNGELPNHVQECVNEVR